MNTPVIVKLVIAGLLVAVWAGLAYLDKTPVEPLIDVIKLFLTGLGVYHLTLVDPAKP